MRSQLIVLIIFLIKTYKCKFNFNCKYIPRIGANVMCSGVLFLHLSEQPVGNSVRLGLAIGKRILFSVVFTPCPPRPPLQ
jgi:hypothetical protein